MGRRRRSLVVAVIIAVLAAACSTPRTPLPGYDSHAEGSPTGVLLDGVLEVRRESPCVLLKPLGEAPIGRLWPPGYAATFDQLKIYDETGAELASEGRSVTLAGGLSPQPNAFCETTMTFQVSEILNRDAPDAS